MLNQRNKKSPLAVLGSVLAGLFVVALLLFAAFNIWVNRTCFVVEVSGNSMLNTVESGDLLYAKNKTKPRRGDVVIISVKDSGFQFSGEHIIKRLIATEGDSVRCENGQISIKYAGQEEYAALNEPYTRGKTPDFEFGREITVGEGEIFFLGDNRQDSYDSTEIGCLKEENVVGVVPVWSLKIKSFTNFWAKMHTSVEVHP